jgi:hypothetical protein
MLQLDRFELCLWVLEYDFCGRYFVGLPRAIIEFSIGKREPLFLRYIGVTDEWWRFECCDCIDGYFWLTILKGDMICEFKYILQYVNDRECMVGLFEVSELVCLWREKIALKWLMNLVYVVYDIICCCSFVYDCCMCVCVCIFL